MTSTLMSETTEARVKNVVSFILIGFGRGKAPDAT
jgi:hypothetical protein